MIRNFAIARKERTPLFRGHQGCGVPETAHNKSLNYKSELWKQSTGLNYRELWAT